MKFLDLFAGVGGIRLGMEQAGHECVGLVEWDKFARKSYQAIHTPDEEFTEKDINDVKAESLPKADCWCFGFPCMVAGTKVATESGIKNIEDITEKDRVVTIDGSLQKVKQTMVKTSNDIYELSIMGQIATQVTGNHPYWVRKRVESYIPNKGPKIVFNNPKWTSVENISKGDLVQSYSPKVNTSKDITLEEAWILGRYVADGYIQDSLRTGRINSYNHKVILTIGKDKSKYFESHLDKYHATVSNEKSINRYIINSKHLMHLAYDFQRGAKNKEIPLWVYGLSDDLKEQFIDGYISGDGYTTPKGYTKCSSISYKLMLSFQKLIEQVYHIGTSLFVDTKPKKYVIAGRVVNQNTVYTLQYKKRGKSQAKCFNGFVWYPVKSVEKEAIIADVYNLEVANNHTYTANGVVVHNCQDISVAGKKGGFTNGKRSSLFFKVTGLIRELKEEDKPSYLFIENVKNLLSINKGWDFAKLLIEMDEIGYDVEWDVIDSAEVVPQHRERIFIVGHLRGRSTRKVFPIIKKGGETTSTNEIKVIGNTSRTGYRSHDVYDQSGIVTTLMARDYKDPKQVAVHQVGNISDNGSFGGNPQVGRVYATDGISPTLNTMQGGGREPKVVVPVITPDRINKRQNGRRFKENGDPMFTINTVDKHGILLKKSTFESSKNLRIRKLTPRECWRLQGFPDWAFDRAKQAGLSDSQLYKQAGNSVTIPVIKAIAENMEVFN